MEAHEVSRFGELALAWLLTRVEGKGGRGDLSRALKPFAQQRWSSGEWGERLDETLARLVEDGHIQQTARKGLVLTREGRARALAALRLERLSKSLTWKQLKSTHLTALALGLAPSATNLARLGRADDMRAVLLQKQLGLGDPGTRSLNQVRDALCWRQLGVESDQPFTAAAVQAVLLSRVLQATREVAPTKAMHQLAARSAGARRTDTESVRLAVLRSWLFPSAAPEGTTPSTPMTQAAAREPQVEVPAPAAVPMTRAPAAPRDGEDGLRSFAENVLRTARTSSTGRFGDDRVFINHVWSAMKGNGMDERAFKRRLVEANQKRLLSLTRADMVELMDPSDVAASEVQHLGATFHFIAL
jgi:hypothetical protein